MKNNIFSMLMLSILTVLLLSGCQEVSREQDSESEINSELPSVEEDVTLDLIIYEDRFISADGKVNYTASALGSVPTGDAASVDVKPHYVTPEEANAFAQVLFNGEDIYETVFTAGEQTHWDAIPCQWTFYPLGHYTGGSKELVDNGKKQIMAIDATSAINDIAYKYVVTIHEDNDFLLSNINVFLSSTVPQNSTWKVMQESSLCSSQKSTEEQIQAAVNSTATILEHMGMGTWEISEYYDEEFIQSDVNYRIVVDAVPVLESVPVLHYNVLDQVSNKTVDTPSYFLTDAQFTYSGSGQLLSCTIQSAIDVNSTNAPQRLMTFDELKAAAKETLTVKTIDEYSARLMQLRDSSDGLVCNVLINTFRYGLTRVNEIGSTNTFTYVPSVAFYGNYDVIDAENSTCLFHSESIDNENDIPLLTLNACTGEILEMQNGKLH